VRLNRSVPACVAVLFIVSITFFWLPTVFLVDVRALVAGYLAGHLAGTMGRGAIAGAIGGLLVFALSAVALAAIGALTVGVVGFLVLSYVETIAFAAIGGIAGRRI
jgi:hypothetical protein